MKGCSILTF